MKSNILIKNGLLLSHGAHIDGKAKGHVEKQADLRIKDGVIAEIGQNLTAHSDERVIDAEGHWVMPGLVDIHTHLRDLGQSDRETIESGTKAAAAGGYTTVLAMANTDPPTDNALVLSRILGTIIEKAAIQVLPVACVTKGMAGQELTNMVELKELGAAAFSDDGMPITNLGVLRRALEYSKLADCTIISHPEDHDLSSGGCMNESPQAVRLGLPAIPTASETACIAREIELAKHTGARLHFAHVSTERAVELIRRARQDGLEVTADVTPHHLTLTDENVIDYDTSFKMNPPLRSQADQEALIKGLKDCTIDAVATDHAPHARHDKSKMFDQAPFGVIGLETAFSLVSEKLLNGKLFSRIDVVSYFTTKPARALRLPEPYLEKGAQANICIFNPKAKWTYNADKGFSKSCNSPYDGRTMTGKIVLTIYRGKVVFDESMELRHVTVNV